MKACNTTGTATNGGYPEATFTWRVARALERQLRARGANVRNATDARHITSARYRRHRFARGLRLGIVAFVLHH
jgi:N-acetylmuramoyl-L-alanine amidase